LIVPFNNGVDFDGRSERGKVIRSEVDLPRSE